MVSNSLTCWPPALTSMVLRRRWTSFVAPGNVTRFDSGSRLASPHLGALRLDARCMTVAEGPVRSFVTRVESSKVEYPAGDVSFVMGSGRRILASARSSAHHFSVLDPALLVIGALQTAKYGLYAKCQLRLTLHMGARLAHSRSHLSCPVAWRYDV